MFNILKHFTTEELVNELSTREGVDKMTAKPYEPVEMSVEGPAIILTVID